MGPREIVGSKITKMFYTGGGCCKTREIPISGIRAKL